MATNVLKSPIGRRTFFLSTMIAVLPLVLVGVISLVEVNRVLADQSRQYLDESARAYGRMVYEKLLIAADLLGSADDDELFGEGSRIFTGAKRLSASGLATGPDIISPADQQLVVRSVDRPTLLVRSVGGTQVLHVALPASDGHIIGRLSADYLWGSEDEFPYAVNYCVLASNLAQPLFCSDTLGEETLERVRSDSNNAGSMNWQRGEEAMTSAFWELFTRSNFDGPILRFVATRPERISTTDWLLFVSIFTPALAEAIGLIILAASAHVRSILSPINTMLAATRRFAQGEFGTQAKVERPDEFGELAESMNSMARQLLTRFNTMRRLSEIDQIILEGTEVDEIADLVLKEALATEGISFAAVAIRDQEPTNDAVWHYTMEGGDEVKLDRLALDDATITAANSKDALQPVGNLEIGVVSAFLNSLGVSHISGVPVAVKGSCEAVLFVGCASPKNFTAAESRRHAGLARRLAVALETRRRENELVHQATIDGLTGLPNRELCRDRLEQALIQARNGEYGLTVAFLDLDRFKNVNDSLGHGAGDQLLIEAASRISSCVGDTETVARLGGDEFVVLIPHDKNERTPEKIVDGILEELSRAFLIGSTQLYMSASIGVAHYPRDGKDVDNLLRKADLAMYSAKEGGRDQAQSFTARMEDRVSRRVTLETELRNAMERNEFSLAYQPQYQIATRKCIAAEALLRWQHPIHGAVSPADFVPIAEESGYIRILGAWVMANACSQFAQWRNDGLPLQRIAVNVSADQFNHADFVSQVADCISDARIDPDCLELEITEGVFVGDLNKAIAILDQLKDIGVSIAIDDFGTGYSSLSYLKSLPFDIVKIDRAFIKDIPRDRDSCAIVNAVAAMTQTLRKQVIAEGIESESQVDYLRHLGVGFGQGFLFAKPLMPPEFEAHLSREVVPQRGAVHSL